jgi:DNA-binding MarR family transcriptional regulator
MREECTSFAEKLTGLFTDLVFKMSLELVRELESMEVTLSQLHALNWIAEHGRRSVGEIADGLQVSHPAAVKLVHRLEEKGWIRRSVPENDHRQSVIHVTGTGLGLVNMVRVERAHRLRRVLDRMSAPDREAMIRGLEGFVTAALKDEKALDGLCWSCQTLQPTDCQDFVEVLSRYAPFAPGPVDRVHAEASMARSGENSAADVGWNER